MKRSEVYIAYSLGIFAKRVGIDTRAGVVSLIDRVLARHLIVWPQDLW